MRMHLLNRQEIVRALFPRGEDYEKVTYDWGVVVDTWQCWLRGHGARPDSRWVFLLRRWLKSLLRKRLHRRRAHLPLHLSVKRLGQINNRASTPLEKLGGVEVWKAPCFLLYISIGQKCLSSWNKPCYPISL
jgi:hypothetical protein